MDENIIKREVKQETEDDLNDGECVDVFGETAKPDIFDDSIALVKPELLAEEESLKEKGEEEYKLQVKKDEEALSDLTEDQRYEKLQDLLNHSKQYSDWLKTKMEQSEKERAKELQEANKGNKKRKISIETSSNAKKTKRSNRLFKDQTIPDEQPMLISGGVMREYQIEGLQWMLNLDQNGINGILADEMGLGKTLQTISLFAHLVEVGVKGPFLIVAPLSTVPNWVKEIRKFAPELPVVLYHGSKEEREELRSKHLGEVHIIKDVFAEPRKVKNIFVTSYEIAINDRAFLRKSMGSPWRYIVVDEGHRLKNTKCRLINELKLYHSANRLLLTGTPLQNNLDELWSLLNFLMPDIFDDVRIFRSWFNAKDLDVVGEDEKRRIIQQERQGNILNMLHQVLSPFLLRRVKLDVDLNIPPKKEILVYCPMTSEQHEFYAATVNKTISSLVGKKDDSDEELEESTSSSIEENGRRSRRSNAAFDYKLILDLEKSDTHNVEKFLEKYDNLANQRNKKYEVGSAYNCASLDKADIRVSAKNRLMDLRKSTNHPYLIEYPLTDDGLFYHVDDNIIEKSGKMKVLDQLLTALLERGHKILIFSQMTRMLDILGDYLNYKKLPTSRLDGSMDFIDRQKNIDQFNETNETNVFLLSTRAGGLGINLTAADTCIIFDSDWNPQQDLQAQDRCHRIGQTKPVVVYRLVTAKTIDEKIVERAAAKRKLEKLVIHRNKFKSQDKKGLEKTLGAISPQELLDLLNSKDHADVFDRQNAPVFSSKDLEKLLDRSDLKKDSSDKENNSQKENSGNRFKVVDSDVSSMGSFGSGRRTQR